MSAFPTPDRGLRYASKTNRIMVLLFDRTVTTHWEHSVGPGLSGSGPVLGLRGFGSTGTFWTLFRVRRVSNTLEALFEVIRGYY